MRDGAGLELAESDFALAVTRVAGRVTGDAAGADLVLADAGQRQVNAVGVAGEAARLDGRDAAHRLGGVGGDGRATVVVDDHGDDLETGRLIVVGDGAGLGLAERDRGIAVSGVAA